MLIELGKYLVSKLCLLDSFVYDDDDVSTRKREIKRGLLMQKKGIIELRTLFQLKKFVNPCQIKKER